MVIVRVGFALEVNMLPVVHLGPFAFYTFGLLFGLSVCLGLSALFRYWRTHGITVNEPLLCACIVGFGLLGAKLDGVLVPAFFLIHVHLSPNQLVDMRGGYTYLGAILLGTAAAGVYARINRIPLLRFFDALFCIALGYGVGRIGCFLAGDGDYGKPSSLPWAMSFPHGIVPTAAHVHPTMLYSAAWELTVFAILWRLSSPRRHALRPGTLLGAYLIATALGRFLVEFLSRNPILSFGLTEAQLVSIVMMAAGTLILARVLVFNNAGLQHAWSPPVDSNENPTHHRESLQEIWSGRLDSN